jgi:hypothetical protein
MVGANGFVVKSFDRTSPGRYLVEAAPLARLNRTRHRGGSCHDETTRALVVEDDVNFREPGGAGAARGPGSAPGRHAGGSAQRLEEGPADVILVDPGLPDGDGPSCFATTRCKATWW